MFTGIIQGQGRVLALQGGSERRFRVRPLFLVPQMTDGESIAVNGVCLSVETHSADDFTVYASAETLARTTLSQLRQGESVNLERALALGDRLGGHMVSGHVDCLATVQSVVAAGQSLRCRLTFPSSYGPEVVAKGSVCLDGISLTVNVCGPDFLEINSIPDTQKRTTMLRWRPGTLVNMETDIIAKYVRSLVGPYVARPNAAVASTPSGSLDYDFLRRNGFL